jgi:hypothetical protein
LRATSSAFGSSDYPSTVTGSQSAAGRSDKRSKISATEARRRKEVALARLREMEADERAGKLIASERIKDAWVKILSAINTGVLRMPDNLAPQLAAAGDARQAGGATVSTHPQRRVPALPMRPFFRETGRTAIFAHAIKIDAQQLDSTILGHKLVAISLNS